MLQAVNETGVRQRGLEPAAVSAKRRLAVCGTEQAPPVAVDDILLSAAGPPTEDDAFLSAVDALGGALASPPPAAPSGSSFSDEQNV